MAWRNRRHVKIVFQLPNCLLVPVIYPWWFRRWLEICSYWVSSTPKLRFQLARRYLGPFLLIHAPCINRWILASRNCHIAVIRHLSHLPGTLLLIMARDCVHLGLRHHSLNRSVQLKELMTHWSDYFFRYHRKVVHRSQYWNHLSHDRFPLGSHQINFDWDLILERLLIGLYIDRVSDVSVESKQDKMDRPTLSDGVRLMSDHEPC